MSDNETDDQDPKGQKDPVRPWHRMDDDWFVDGAVRATGFAWAWPLITAAVKRGAGKVARLDLSDRALFDLGQVSGCPSGRTWTILEAFSDPEVGLLVADDDGGFVIPKWGSKQVGAQSTERWRRWKAKQPKEPKQPRKSNVKPTPQTLASVGKRSANADKQEPTPSNHDGTGQDTTTTEPHAAEAAVVVANAHSGVREDAAPPAATPTPTAPSPDHGDPDLQATIEAYRCGMASARGGGRAQFLPSGLLAQVLKLHADFGGPMVRQAIEEAIGAKNEIPGPSYVRAICQRMRDDPGERRPGPSMHQRRPGADPGVFRAKGPVACMMDGNPDEAFGPRLPEDQEDDSHAV